MGWRSAHRADLSTFKHRAGKRTLNQRLSDTCLASDEGVSLGTTAFNTDFCALSGLTAALLSVGK